MAGQGGFFDAEERLRWLSASGDPLERLRAVVDFEAFRAELEAALPLAVSGNARKAASSGAVSGQQVGDGSNAGAPPPPAVFRGALSSRTERSRNRRSPAALALDLLTASPSRPQRSALWRPVLSEAFDVVDSIQIDRTL